MRILLIFFLLLYSSVGLAEPLPWQMTFQTAASPLMQEIEWIHHFCMVIISAIVALILGLLLYVAIKFNAKANPVPATFSHNVLLEVIWTIVPFIILIVIAVPSFPVLRLAETVPETDLTIKVVGYQWYWNYKYQQDNIEFDSNIVPDDKLLPGQRRLFEVDNHLVLPEDTPIKFLITGADVVHSFAVPALGIKTDAVPGRTNHTWTKVLKKGIYYGQCSELCGVNHGFMPIVVEVVSKEEFEVWRKQKAPTASIRKSMASNSL